MTAPWPLVLLTVAVVFIGVARTITNVTAVRLLDLTGIVLAAAVLITYLTAVWH